MIKKHLVIGFLAGLLTIGSWTANASDLPPLFDTVEYRHGSFDALPQWQRVLGEIEQEKVAYQACDDAFSDCEQRALMAWQALINSLKNLPALEQLRAVNRFVNRWPARTDQANHQQDDYWASPLTFLRRSGDCEDYAIMKYVSLRHLGFDAEQLRLVVVRDRLRDRTHAILAVHVEDEVLVLDNLFQAVLPQRLVRQYTPYYSVNENARFAHLPPDSLMLASTPWAVAPSMTALDIDAPAPAGG